MEWGFGGGTIPLLQAWRHNGMSMGSAAAFMITDPLKTAADRLYAELKCPGYGGFVKESVLLMTADGADYSQAATWYRTYERNLRWKNRGEVLGKGKTEAAYQLGASL